MNRKPTIKKSRKQKCEEKQLYSYFKRQTKEISHEVTGTWLRKGNLEKETESLLITAPKKKKKKKKTI